MNTRKNDHNFDHPLDGDSLTERSDTPDPGMPPAELNAAQNYFVMSTNVSASLSHQKNELSLTRIEGYENAFGFVNGNTIFGHIPEKLVAVEVHKMLDGSAQKDAEPHVPKWSGVSFLPRASSMITRSRFLRRRSGARVQPEYVLPPPEETRKVYFPNSYPWRVVGRLFVWNNASAPNFAWSGSASLVGRNVILTASHMLPWSSGSNWKALFVPGYYDGQSVFGANAASWVTAGQGYRNFAQGDDMAVLRLAQPLGEWLGYFGYKTYNDDWEDGNYWSMAGYPSDIAGAQRPSANYWFPIIDDDSDGAGVELEYQVDTNGGNSGGPVFGWWDGKPYVVGTHSGGEDNFGEPRQNVAAGGSALSSLIAWARANW
jgi:V8-like Glu-specific endopeptidase